MAEPQPGAPGGTSGPRNATAATFQVNDESLRSLHKTWVDLTKAVKDFSTAVAGLSKHKDDIEGLQRALGNLGVGGSGSGRGAGGTGGTGRNGGDSTFSAPVGAAQADAVPGAPAGAPAQAGSASAAAASRGMGWRTAVSFGARAGAVGLGVAALASPRQGVIDNDLLYNELARGAGAYNAQNYGQQREAVLAAGGYQSTEDLMAARGILRTAGQATATSAGGRDALRQAGQLASLRPDAGLTGAYNTQATLANPVTFNRLQGIGVQTRGIGGARESGPQVFDGILRQLFPTGRFTANQISAGMQPGMPLQRSLDYLLPDPDAQEAFRSYAMTRASLGETSTQRAGGQAVRAMELQRQRTMGEEITGGDADLLRRSGLGESVQANRNTFSAATTRGANAVLAGTREGLNQGFETLAAATDELTDAFRALTGTVGADANANPIGDALGFGGAVASPLNTALAAFGGVSGGLMAAPMIGAAWNWLRGGRRGGGGGGTGGNGGTGGTGSNGGSGGGVFDMTDVQKVFVINWPLGGFGGGGPGGGPGGPGPAPVPVGGGWRSRIAGAARAAGRTAMRYGGRILPAVGAAAATAGGLEVVSDRFEELYGQRDAEGRRGLGDRLGRGFARVGTYAAGGAALGGTLGLMGGPFAGLTVPVGAAAGATIGTLYGSVHAAHDWFTGSNRAVIPPAGASAPVNPANAPRGEYIAPTADSRGNMTGLPMFSRGGVVPGHHSLDTVDIKATPGELVVPLRVVGRYGGARKLMRMLGFDAERDKTGHYAQGGVVQAPPGSQAGGGGGTANGQIKWELGPANIVPLFAGGKQVVGGINSAIAGSVRGFLDELVASGYKMRSVGGFNRRTIANTSKWSNHAYGAAIDIDPFGEGNGFDTGTQSKIGTGFKGDAWIIQLARKYGLGWGGEWKNKRDWMHFEAIGSPAAGSRYGGTTANLVADTGSASQPGEHNAPAAEAKPMVPFGSVYRSEAEALSSILASAGGMGGIRALGAAVKSQSAKAQPGQAEVATAAAPANGAEAAPATVSGNVLLGKQKAEARGWTGGEWDALYNLWQGESNWDHKAANPRSSARGIPQAMMSAHFGRDWATKPDARDWLNNPGRQIDWGLDYIAGRYQTPSNAYRTWKARDPHWYEKGAWEVVQDELAQLHAGEMVVPRREAAKLRSMLQHARTARGSEHGVEVVPAGGGGRTVNVSITAPITVVGQARQEDARDFLAMVRREAETNETLDFIGAG